MDHLLNIVKGIQKFRETCNLKHSYRNELEKSCFAHDAAYCVSKGLARRTISDKVLKDRAYEIAKNCGYDGYQRALVSMVYKIFDKKTGPRASVNEQLDEELHKPVTERFKKRKVYARFRDNIWATDLVQMELLYSKNKNVKYLLCIIYVFTKYAWFKLLKEKKVKQFLMSYRNSK